MSEERTDASGGASTDGGPADGDPEEGDEAPAEDVSGEAKAIERTDAPLTVPRLVEDLRDLGVAAGDTLLVHASMSSLGWVAVGPSTVVDALMEVVTPDGTLVMPTHSPQYTDPADWERPPVPDDWVDEIRTSRPPFRPEVTPTRGMGAVAECFRTYPDAIRSRHPTYSFTARGADAESVVSDHALDHGLGESSPLAGVYERDGSVLMLGTGHETDTSLHLAEHRSGHEQGTVVESAPVVGDDGERETVEFEELDYDSDDFGDAGRDFERDCPEAVTEGTVGIADARLVSQRDLVDYGAAWFERNRE